MPPTSPDVLRYIKAGTTYGEYSQPLYDMLALATGVIGDQQYFAVPVGGAKTELQTNMRLQGQIPADHVFELWSPRIVVAPTADPDAAIALVAANAANDVYRLIHGGFFRMRIVSDEKLLCPIYFLPAGMGFNQTAAASVTAATSIVPATNGAPHQGAARVLSTPIVIPPLQQFTVTLSFPVAITLSANVNVWVVLDGTMHRPALP